MDNYTKRPLVKFHKAAVFYALLLVFSLIFTQALRATASAVLFWFLVLVPILSLIYVLVGKALVIPCMQYGAGEEIGMEALAPVRQLADEADFLLFHTGWSQYWGKAEYFGDYPVPSQEVCRYALESGKKGLGFDTIGIDPIADEGLTRHRLLLSQRDIVIIENLTNLDKIGEGLFLFAALPLKYENADGAPVRAVAMLEEE